MPPAPNQPQILHRFFFAVLPPERERNRAAVLRDKLDPPGNPVRRDRLHVTMALTGDYETYPDDVAGQLLVIGDGVRAPPAWVRLDRLSGGRGLVLLRSSRKLGDLHLLYKELDAPLLGKGLRRPGWTYDPHLSLTYRKGEPFVRSIEPVEWLAKEFVLVHSLVGRTQHSILKTWPLIAPQGDLFA